MDNSRAGHYLTSEHELRTLLDSAGVRPTAQRIAIARLLYGGAPRHATASSLHFEAAQAGCSVSMATVYNTLGEFVRAGLLREVRVDSDRTYFDTNGGPHCHIFDVDTGELRDAPLPTVEAPQGLNGVEIVGVDVIFRVRSTEPAAH